MVKGVASAAGVLAAAVALGAAITFVPSQPRAGQNVTFTLSDSLQVRTELGVIWDFGDGSTSTGYSFIATHIYHEVGTFTVRAEYWATPAAGGPAPVLRTSQTQVAVEPGEAIGPRAAFRVSYLALRFEDGKSYKVVPKNFVGLKALVDVKFEGSGLLQFDWLVDGAVFRQETRTLTFARQMTIDLPLAAGLPTQIPGLHSVSLRLRSPLPEFSPPVIRYFVTAGEAAPSAPRVVMDITATVGMNGQASPLAGNSLSVPAGGYGLFKGQLKNESRTKVALGLLRVTIEGRVSDLQLVRAIGPGETRAFLTSVFRPLAEEGKNPGTVLVSFYDLSATPPLLLVARKLSVGDLP
jgi:hypothetical protein